MELEKFSCHIYQSYKEGEICLKNMLQQVNGEIKQLSLLPDDTFDKLYSMLEKIKLPIKGEHNNHHNFGRHQAMTMGASKARFSGKILPLSYYSKKHPDLFLEIKRIGKLICPIDFSSIHVNHNVTCPKHFDSNNVDESCLVSFGKYEGGELVVEEKDW